MSLLFPAIIVTALAVGALLAKRTQRRLALTPREKLAVGIGAYAGAMIGAKLPFVLSDWDGLLSGAAWFSDGKTILCGLVGGYFGVEIAKWSLDLRVKTGDSFAVPVSAAVGVGRLGCFFAGCCYGVPTHVPWAVVFPHIDRLPRHPIQLYESAFHLSCAGVLALLYRRGMFRGQLIKLYIIVYCGYRFATEYLRPEIRFWGGWTGYQGACLVLIALFSWMWWRESATARLYAVVGEGGH